jgi:transcriptional regulator with XRE-family HTH domain
MFSEASETPEEKAFAKELASDLAQRSLVHYLFAARSAQGVSQKEMAERMGCSQSRISKLENSLDAELNVGDLMSYLGALNLKSQVMVLRKDATIFDEIKAYAFRIRACLSEMVRLAGDDPEIGAGVSRAHIETMANLVRFVVKSLRNLPNVRAHLSPILDADNRINSPAATETPRSSRRCVSPAV